jgi:hypothetical protein
VRLRPALEYLPSRPAASPLPAGFAGTAAVLDAAATPVPMLDIPLGGVRLRRGMRTTPNPGADLTRTMQASSEAVDVQAELRGLYAANVAIGMSGGGLILSCSEHELYGEAVPRLARAISLLEDRQVLELVCELMDLVASARAA